ncbi:hypothetical protein EMN47_10270 [Prolixibacteraceae bacterium JC049]|nr:hypothetical protein [Prolixibacteraceae bacterium JC049]
MQKLRHILLLAVVAIAFGACNCKKSNETTQQKETCYHNDAVMAKIQQTNYYKDGAFDKAAAKEAYYQLMRYYGVPVAPVLKTAEFWVSDFAQKDFPNIGMGGIFWVNNIDHGYFGHDIYLLPGQMLVEHKHHAVENGAAKMESWHMRHGSAYFFGEGDATTPLPVKIPQSQIDKGAANSKNCKLLKEGGVLTLNKTGAWHFIIAGPKGAIITEYASPHFNEGLEFANKSVVF